MKIKKVFFIATLLFALASNAQISKGNWIMGGSISFSHYKSTNPSSGYTGSESNNFYMNPNIGYFFMDKLAIGATVPLNLSTGHDTGYGIGPFARYYFLEKEKQINIFSQISYDLFKNSNSDYKVQEFNIKAGAVFFLNSSVGLEVALNYLNQETNQDMHTRGISLGVGFQIHLEKK